MRASLLLLAVVLAGCGSRVIDGRHVEPLEDASGADSHFVDTFVLDTFDTAVEDSFVFDTAPVDTGPPVCDEPVSGVTCPTVTTKGAKVCTDLMIQKIIDACFNADPSGCSSARSTYAACGTCMLETFLSPSGFIDVGACMKKTKPSSPCAASVTCVYQCWSQACSSCDPTVNASGSSEYNDCIIRQSDPSGSCWSFGGSEYTSCTTDPDLRVCVPNTVDELLPFYRGACRDGGDWSKTTTKDGTLP